MSTPGSPKSNRRTTAQEDSTPLRPAKKQKPPDPTLDGKTTKLLLGSAVIGQKIDDNAQLSIKKSGDYKVTGKPFNWRGVVTAIEKLGDNGLMKITLTPITLATNSVTSCSAIAFITARNDSRSNESSSVTAPYQ